MNFLKGEELHLELLGKMIATIVAYNYSMLTELVGKFFLD